MVERNRPSQRSQRSQRSHGTSSSSSHEKPFTCKDFCRKFVSFMCTQVGVGGVVVSYAIIGAVTFMNIEGRSDRNLINLTQPIHHQTVKKMWNLTQKYNIFEDNRHDWTVSINETLWNFQEIIVEKINKEGYDGRDHKVIWENFSATLMFCLSVFTMIGYGHMTPKTEWGKIATIIYATIGIPLYIVYFMNMGKVFSKSFKFLYRAGYKCLNRDKQYEDMERNGWDDTPIVVPSTACIWVMIFYMLVGTIMFAVWENWTYLDAWYFSFTSLAKIGIGDFVPGRNKYGGDTWFENSNSWKLLINFMYLLIGMGLIAMCYTLMKEEILLKLHATRQEIREKCYYCGIRIGLYTEDSHEDIPEYRPRPRSVRRSVRRR